MTPVFPPLRCVVFCLSVLLASQVGTQLAAWQFAHHPVLGCRLPSRVQPLYPPYGLYQWTWGLWHTAGAGAFERRLRLAWTGWALVLAGGLICLEQRRRQSGRPVDRLGTRRDLAQAGLLSRVGVVLGRTGWRGRVVMDDGPTHVLIVGASRVGKGENTVLPTLLGGWQQSVLVYDPKGELAAMTAAYRSTFSTVVQCDPTSRTTQGCNLLSSVVVDAPDEHRASARLMGRLTDPDGTASQHESQTAKHFRELAITIGQGLLLYGLRHGHSSLGAIAHFLYSTPTADLAAALSTQAHPLIFNAGSRLSSMDDPQREGLLSNLQRAFGPFMDPGVARLTGRDDFCLQTLRQGTRPLSLYYGVPFGDQDHLRSVTRLWFQTVFDALLRSLTDWHHRCLILLDEVTTLRHFPLLVDGFDFAAGYGIKLCILTTSLHRLESVYGMHQNFEEGSAVRLFFAPNTRRMSTRLAYETGDQERPRTRTSRPMGLAASGGRTVSEDRERVPLLSAPEIAQLGANQVLLRVGDQLTMPLRKIRAWKEQPWKARRTPLP